MDGNDWQSTFLDKLTNDPGQEEDEDNDCETEDDNAGQDVVPKIKSYKEVCSRSSVTYCLVHGYYYVQKL